MFEFECHLSMILIPPVPHPRNAICELGKRGAASGSVRLLPEHSEAATWLVERELAYHNAAGKLVLHSSALVFATILSNPKQVFDPPDLLNCSLWSLRRKLVCQGWSKAASGKSASIEKKMFNAKSEHQAYYAILLESNMGILFKVHFPSFRATLSHHSGYTFELDAIIFVYA